MALKLSDETINTYNSNLKLVMTLDLNSIIIKYRKNIAINDKEVAEDILTALNLFKTLNPIDISMASDAAVTDINRALDEFLNWIKTFEEFCLSSKMDTSETMSLSLKDLMIKQKAIIKDKCDEIMTELYTKYSEWFNIISRLVAFCTMVTTGYNVLSKDARNAFKTFKELTMQTEKEAAAMLEAMKKASANVGVTKHTENFAKAAKDFEITKFIWLFATILVGISIVAYAKCSLKYPVQIDSPTVYSFLQAVLPRFTILAVSFYALTICATNYKAQEHNYIVNKNKQNALSTFETFVHAAEDDSDIKNAVLLQTTKAIFSNTPTGYLKNESGDDSSTQIIEIARNMSKTMTK